MQKRFDTIAQMNLVFDIASSIEFWRQRYPTNRKPKPPLSIAPNNAAYLKSDIMALMPDWVDNQFLEPTGGIFHALAFDAHRCKTLKEISVHIWTDPIPEGSFYELQPNVYVESPAFMFLHAASILDFASLIAFGDELCGLYSFDAREKRGFRKRKFSLITSAGLLHFLETAKNCRGAKRALRALGYVVDNSASPMETFDEMTMCLPYRLGGYGFPCMNMNEEITLTARAARIAKRNKCRLDMGYKDLFLDIEHHGKLDHSTDEEKESDFARVSGLKEMGFEVIELTKAQVGDLIAYEIIIQRIAKEKLHKRLRKSALGATPERLALRKALFTWNNSNGRIR